YIIYAFVRAIGDNISSPKRVKPLSRERRLDIGSRLEQLSRTKFPTLSGVQHDGYLLISLAQAHRVRQAEWPKWADLISEANKIPNRADKAFVLSTIAAALPSKHRQEAERLLDEAKSLIEQIPSALDRIDEYENLAECASTLNSNLSRACVRLAMSAGTDVNDRTLVSRQRRIVD